MDKANLNQYLNKFEIITQGGAQITQIEEPIDWAGQDIILRRDSKYHGVNYEFTDAEVPLKFDCVAGKELLVGLYNTYGNDAIAFLRFSSFIDGEWVAEPDMIIDFNFFEYDHTTVSFTLKRTSFEDLFRTRFSVDVDLTSSKDLDGNTITPIVPIDIELHSKGLFLQTNREFSDSNLEYGTPPLKSSGLLELRYEDNPILSNLNGGSSVQFREQTFYAQPAFDKLIFDDIKENQNIPFGVSLTGPNPQYVLESAGILTVNFGLVWNASLHLSSQWRGSRQELKVVGCSRGDAYMSFSSVELILQIGTEEIQIAAFDDFNAGCNLKINQSGYYFESNFPEQPVPPFSNELQNDFIGKPNPVPGDPYLYTSTNFDNSAITVFRTLPALEPATFEYNQDTIVRTVNKGDVVALYVRMYGSGSYDRHGTQNSDMGWFAQAAFYNEDLNSPANKSYLNMSLNSEEETTISSGYLVHEALDKMIEISTGLNSRLRSSFIGRTDLGYLSDGCGSKNVILNGFAIRNFNSDTQPLNTSIESFIDNLRSIYDMGYGFGKDGEDDIIIFERTEFFYQDALIRQVSDPANYRVIIDSDNIYNEIEIGYESFQQDGINLIDDPNTRRTWLMPIRTEKKKLEIIATYISSGYTIEIQRREQFNQSPSNSLDWDESIFIIAVRLDGMDWKSEKNEAFTTVNNVFSPQTSYNLRLTPARMLRRWGRSLKGSLRYKSATTDPLRFISGYKNNELETETNDVCEQPGLIAENGDIILNEFPDTNQGLFSPEIIEFNEQLNWSEFKVVRDALQGNSLLGDNYGYISVIDPDGIEQQGWPMEIKYNKSTREAFYKLRRKWQ